MGRAVRWRTGTVMAVQLLTLGAPLRSLSSQEVVHFDRAPTCGDGCDVQLVPVLTLGPQTLDGRPVILSESPLVYRDEEGRYYVGDRSSSEVFVYSVEGRLVGEF